MLLLLSLFGIVLQSYIYLFRESYISELLISFLPYAIGINFLLSFFALYKSISNFLKKKIFLTVVWCMTSIISFWFLISYLYPYIHTYTNIIPSNNQEQTLTLSGWLSFLYANIYHKNKDFAGLLSTIQDHNPDIILLVEYAKIHDEYLSPLLKQKYPYVSRYVGGKWYDGDVIYSRYPLKKIKHEVYPWSFSHVSIEYNNKNIDFALIHTSAPVSEHFFTMRNEQLANLSDLMSKYHFENPTKNMILVGDFNLSPWSYYYTSFDITMRSLWLSNITTHLSTTHYDTTYFPYTRCHEQAPYLCSHIDHIRSNESNISLEKITIPWSDHDGFVGKI